MLLTFAFFIAYKLDIVICIHHKYRKNIKKIGNYYTRNSRKYPCNIQYLVLPYIVQDKNTNTRYSLRGTKDGRTCGISGTDQKA